MNNEYMNNQITADTQALAKKLGLQVEVQDADSPEYPRNNYTSVLVSSKRRWAVGTNDVVMAQELWGQNVFDAVTNYCRVHKIKQSDLLWQPVYAYIHSGVALSRSQFGCKWDSGLIGFIYELKPQLRDEFGCKRIAKKLKEKILARLDSELDETQAWINGEMFEIVVMDEDGVHELSSGPICKASADELNTYACDMLKDVHSWKDAA